MRSDGLDDRYFGMMATEEDAASFWGLFIGIIVSSLATFAIGFSTSWCVRVTSSTTFR